MGMSQGSSQIWESARAAVKYGNEAGQQSNMGMRQGNSQIRAAVKYGNQPG